MPSLATSVIILARNLKLEGSSNVLPEKYLFFTVRERLSSMGHNTS